MTTIYVGNLPFTATEDEVRALFERHGKVESVKLINDRETGRPRGFAFVDMAAGDAQNAIQQTNGFQMGGRPLAVRVAAAAARMDWPRDKLRIQVLDDGRTSDHEQLARAIADEHRDRDPGEQEHVHPAAGGDPAPEALADRLSVRSGHSGPNVCRGGAGPRSMRAPR